MPNVLESAYVAAKVYLMKRRQFDNIKLRSYFKTQYNIDVGLYSYGCFDRWRMPGPMTVGRYCSIAKTVRSTLNDHPLRTLTTHPALYSRAFGVVDADAEMGGSLVIEDDVWIGHNVVILSGCRRIGRGAVIGAGSIVTRDVDRYAVVVGNPAHKLKDRFEPEMVAAIEESRWWELGLSELRRLVETRRELVFNPTVGLVRDWIAQRRVE